MKIDKQYNGYQPYEYLDEEDIDQVEVFEEIQYGEPYKLSLTDAQEQRVKTVTDQFPIISLHDHPIQLPSSMDKYDRYTSDAWFSFEYDGIAQSPLDAVFVSHLGVRKWEEAINALGKSMSDIAHQNLLIPGQSVDDIYRAFNEGKVAIIPTIETCMPIENELDRLDVLYGLGIRSLGITYSESNALGTGLGEAFQGGLTKFGERAVERMNKIGILIDVSHASDQTSLDVCEASEKPVIASHNGAKSLIDIERLDPDEVLEAVASTGGLVGVQSAPHTTSTENHPRHDIEGVMEHFEYIVELVGIDHVTFGPDLLYGDHFGQHEFFGKDMNQFPDFVQTEINYTRGMDNPTEAWHNIIRWLVKHDYTDEEIRKVLSDNTLRVIEEVWG